VSLSLAENSSQTFTVTVQNDPSNLGVTWAIACVVDAYDADGDCTNGSTDTYDGDSDNAFLSSTAGTSSTSNGVITYSNTLTTPLFVPPGGTTKLTLTVKSKAETSGGQQLAVVITVSVP
jgi:hypothetical protein